MPPRTPALALDFKLATSPPLAVAWAAGLCIEALTRLGRFDDSEAVAAVAAGREPPPGWIHTLGFQQAAGRPAGRAGDAEALDDLLAAGEGWRALGIEKSLRRVLAYHRGCRACHAGHPQGRQRRERLIRFARKAGPRHARRGAPGARRRPRQGAPGDQMTRESLAGPSALLEAAPAPVPRLALTLADLGTFLRPVEGGVPTPWPAAPRPGPGAAHRAAPLADQAQAGLLAAGARPRRTALTGPDALTSATACRPALRPPAACPTG